MVSSAHKPSFIPNLKLTRTALTAQQVIRFYNHDKAAIEENFREIKSPDLVRFSPLRHFTDTKIRLYAMVCVLALLVLKVMMLKIQDVGLSVDAMVQELADIQEVILVYSPTKAVHTLTERATVQQRLLDIFNLQRYLPNS